jgi:hypothetical protein
MTKVLEFYHKSFGKALSTFEVSKAFELVVGVSVKARDLMQLQLT